jgi:hypothetical protein
MRDIGSYLSFVGVPVVFALIVLYLFGPGSRRKHRRDAEIRFREDGNERHRD